MKSRRRRAEDTPADVDIAPLIDVVFLLIIFFMSIWQAAHMEVAGELSLPLATQADPEIQQDSDRLVINIDSHGGYHVANQRMSPEDLYRLLLREGAVSRDDEGFSTRPVYIRGDADLPFEHVQRVMRMSRDARIWKLTLRAVGEEGVQ